MGGKEGRVGEPALKYAVQSWRFLSCAPPLRAVLGSATPVVVLLVSSRFSGLTVVGWIPAPQTSCTGQLCFKTEALRHWAGAGVVRNSLSFGSDVSLRSLVTFELRFYRKKERARSLGTSALHRTVGSVQSYFVQTRASDEKSNTHTHSRTMFNAVHFKPQLCVRLCEKSVDPVKLCFFPLLV